MKTNIISSVIFIFLFLWWSPTTAQSQLSKEEKKKWKRERRAMSPEQLKQLVESKERLESLEDSLLEANESLQQKVREQERTRSRLRERVGKLERDNQELAQKGRRMEVQKETAPKKSTENWDQGVAFRIQIGAIEEKHAQGFEEGTPEFEITKEDGYLKYLVGYFRDYEEADKLKKELRVLGLKSAWVVPFKDGNRVLLKEVLSTLE